MTAVPDPADTFTSFYKQLDYMAETVTRLEEQMTEQINPREFGRLEADVGALKSTVADMRTEIAEQGKKLDQLIGLASEGKGGIRALWFAGSVVAGVLGWLGADKILHR